MDAALPHLEVNNFALDFMMYDYLDKMQRVNFNSTATHHSQKKHKLLGKVWKLSIHDAEVVESEVREGKKG